MIERARALVDRGGRALLGITGAPGAGKSTLARDLAEALRADGVTVALVPMDGFHLPQADLVRRGLRDVMGRIDTFDADGYLALLRRLRDETDQTITAPDFDRTIEEPVIDAIRVEPDVQLVLTEGNYLLDDEPPWPDVRAALDGVWFVETDEASRVEHLLARHVEFGKTEEDARRWMARVDEPNARRITARRGEGDFVVDLR
ncbi:MAG: nucleoside/nucleotide kinase family protein [Aeromicrobium sp.]